MNTVDKITIGIAIWVVGVATGYFWAWKALEGVLR